MIGAVNLIDLPKLDATNDNVGISATASQTGAVLISHVVSAATINATVLKASPGRLMFVDILNNFNAADSYIKFYNLAVTPDPSAGGVNVPVYKIRAPGTGDGDTTRSQFRGFGPGIGFSAGIAFVIVAASGDTDETAVAAGEFQVTLGYI